MKTAAPHRCQRAVPLLLVGILAGACTGQLDRSPGPNGGGTGSADASATGNGGSGTAVGSAGVTGTFMPPITGFAGTTGAAGTGSGIQTGAAGVTGAAGTTGSSGTTGAAGTGAAGTGTPDAGASDGSVDGSVSCQVSIAPAAPSVSLFGLEYGPGAVLRVHATVSGYAGTPTWTWQVSIVGVMDPPPKTVVDDTGSTIEIKLTAPGNYTIKAEVVGASECNRGLPLVVKVNNPSPPAFVFRVTPPSAARLPILETTIKVSELADRRQLDLGGADAARVVSLAPLDTAGFPLPSYVRLTGSSFSIDLEAYTGRGPFVAALAADLDYQLLIVPDAAVAPLIVRGRPDLIVQKMSVTQGMSVAGEARDGAGQPVAGAHVILRDGELPSTVGVSDAAGSFRVLMRAGTLAAVIVPPVGSGLPDARVPATPGIDLRAGTNNMAVVMRWAAAPAGSLTLTVRGTDGTTPVAGARVRAESSDEIPSVGTLTVTVPASGIADVALAASGTVRADAVTDAKGLANLGVLRAGSYRVVVAPPEDGAPASVTSTTFTLPAAGLARDVRLASPVTVTGTLTPVAKTAGTRVTAVDLGVFAPAAQASAVADADGKYTLHLAPSRTYELLVEPPAGRGLARAVVALVTPGANPQPRTDAVPAALQWSGTVTSVGRRVAGAVVQVFCGNCLDTKIAVGQGVTRADGTLDLVLPAPASAP